MRFREPNGTLVRTWDYIKELVAYWRDGFDWRAAEAGLNSVANFYTTIEGQGIHFILEKGQGPNPMPIIVNARVARLHIRDEQDNPDADGPGEPRRRPG